jgi:hypothetical protein
MFLLNTLYTPNTNAVQFRAAFSFGRSCDRLPAIEAPHSPSESIFKQPTRSPLRSLGPYGSRRPRNARLLTMRVQPRAKCSDLTLRSGHRPRLEGWATKISAHIRDPAARKYPGSTESIVPLDRGRRESRVSDAPAASCVKMKTHELVTTGSPVKPAFPAQWLYGLLRALPGDRALLPPSPARRERVFADLNASVGASGPHGFTVRASLLRPARRRVHRIPHPTSVTTRTPLSSGRDGAGHRTDFSSRERKKFFEKRLDRRSAKQPVGQINCRRKSS